MRVGIDIDNVLAWTFDKVVKEANQAPFNVPCTFEGWEAYDFWKSFDISEKDCINMFGKLSDKGLFSSLAVLPACKYVMSRYKFQKFFITSRHAAHEPVTKDWLQSNEIAFDESQVFFVGSGSWIAKEIKSRYKRKAFLADKLKLDCFIEDEGEVALEIAELGIPVILFNFPWNQHISHPNVHRVGHWRDKASYWKETENIIRKIKK